MLALYLTRFYVARILLTRFLHVPSYLYTVLKLINISNRDHHLQYMQDIAFKRIFLIGNMYGCLDSQLRQLIRCQ